MKETEVRIGNLIHREASKTIERSKGIHEKTSYFSEKDIIVTKDTLCGFKDGFYCGTPITKELLTIEGFDVVSYIATGDFIINGTKRLVSIGDYEYNIIVYALDYDNWHLKIVTNPRMDEKYRKEQDLSLKTLKYVHQLQNLYYVLTGDELKFKQHETTI
tara:strand:+ start:587 stop:1066 length:480 start_codon:yes stop_codon:yes gene_type:complete